MKTIKTYVGEVGRTVYPVDFDLGYLDRSHIYVYAGSTPTNQLTYSWLNDNQIELTVPYTTGAEFTIRRITPRNEIFNDYENGAILEERNLDDSFKQTLMVLEEWEDGSFPDGLRLLNFIDMQGNRILNLPKPTTPNEPLRLQDLIDFNTDGVIEVGGGSGIEYVDTNQPTTVAETTTFNQNEYKLGFTIDNASNPAVLLFDMLGSYGTSSGGGGGGTFSLTNSTGTGNTLVKTISSTASEVKRIKQGANVTITDDGNALTISSVGGGGGTTTTLSNAGVTGIGLVKDVVGSDYGIKRLIQGTNVTLTEGADGVTISASSGGGGGFSIQNVNDAVGVGVYKETVGNTGFFRRLQSSDNSVNLLADFDDIDLTIPTLTYSKLNNVPSGVLLGRGAVGTGTIQAITLGANLTLTTAGVLSAAGGGGVTDGDKGDIVVSSGGTTWSLDTAVVSTFARTLLDDTTAAGMRSTLGLGTSATSDSSAFQPADATLTALAGVTTAANKLIYATGSDAFLTTDITALARTLLAGAAVNNMLTALGIITITNANGTTLRFPTAGATSGIQICFKTGLSTGSISTAHGNVFIGAGEFWAFPNAFTAAPSVFGFVTNAAPAWVGGGASATDTSAAYFRGYSGVSGTVGTVCMVAIGTY